jgi:uncharacterized protein (TIGR02466 family)
MKSNGAISHLSTKPKWIEPSHLPIPEQAMLYSNNLQGIQLWPSMIFFQLWPELNRFRYVLSKAILDLKHQQSSAIESNIALNAKPRSGLYESNFDLFSMDIPGIADLSRFIESSLKLAVQVAHSSAIQADSVMVQFTDSWYHVTTRGGFHDAHWHHGCSWCGIFYLDLGDYKHDENHSPNGGSRFYCPIGSGGAHRDAGNRYMHPHFDPPLQEGLLLIFPSHLLHSGLPYSGTKERIVIAFNAQVYANSKTQRS